MLRLWLCYCLQSLVSPLILACKRGHEDVVQLLLQQPHLFINRCDADGVSALEHAVRGGYTRIVRLLLSTAGIRVTQVSVSVCNRICSIQLMIAKLFDFRTTLRYPNTHTATRSERTFSISVSKQGTSHFATPILQRASVLFCRASTSRVQASV